MSLRTLLPKHVVAVIKYQKDPLRALEMFNSAARDDGFKHNLFTYKCMVDKLGSHGKFKAMEDIISEMRINLDNSLLEGVYVSSMKSYGKRGMVQDAVNTFERMDFYGCELTVVSYNTIMNILVEFMHYDQAHKVYLRMLDKGIVPDIYTFTIRIKSFCRTQRPHVALRLLRNLSHRGCPANAVAYCTVVSGLYEENCHCEACNLFDEMLSRKLYPDILTFNKLINVLCQKGEVVESYKLVAKILKRGTSLNLFTYNILIQGLCKDSKVSDAISLFHHIGDDLAPDVVSYNTLISGLCKHSKLVEAAHYLHKMTNEGCIPNDFTYNTIINGYCKLGQVHDACNLLKDAEFKGFVPDHVTYCSLINGLCEEGETDRAFELFDESQRKGLKPNTEIYNSLIKGLSQQGLILQALDVMNDEMIENGFNPDICTYNIIINGLCKMGNVSYACIVLNDAIAKRYLPDVFTFNTLIDGYCKQLKLDQALEIVDRMWTHGLVPDVITYNSVLNGLCKAGKTTDVIETFSGMVKRGCRPNVITYNILIENLCKANKIQEASELLVKMVNEGLTPDTISFSTLIHGFCRNTDLDGAYDLFKKLEDRKGLLPNGYTYRVLVNGFCKTGNIDFAYKYLTDMLNKGFVPTMATFGQVINCLSKKGQDETYGPHLLNSISYIGARAITGAGRVWFSLWVELYINGSTGSISVMKHIVVIDMLVFTELNRTNKETAQNQVLIGMVIKPSNISNLHYQAFARHGSGVSTDIQTSYAARIMAISIIPFVVVQLPRVFNFPSGQRLAVLISLIVAVALLVSYCVYQIFQPWIQRRRLAYAKHKHVISGILRHAQMQALGRLMDKEGTPNPDVLKMLFHKLDENSDGSLSHAELRALIIGLQIDEINLDMDDAVKKIMDDFDTSRNSTIEEQEFVVGISKWLTEARHYVGNTSSYSKKFMDEFHSKTREDHDTLIDQSDEVVESVDNPGLIIFKAILLLLLGTLLAAIFADPLVDAVDNFSLATSIPSFFISFIAMPLATNSSEAVSSIIFARRKKQRTSSLTFSEIYGGVTMNNTLCLAVFLALVYFRGLTWDFSAEVLIILIVCVVMGHFASFRTTFALWTCFVAFLLYPFSLGLVYLLDFVFGWS
ncbi:hypothetical protein ZIOFF_020498 [Zingiber officinale]|uniref:EF-hand domain-containing protein n=1 Tax=Zingiber officinale TaxID=94328 RepID=A0A8J5H2E0_ZINOF|nr:hypothetical protein ZIOFF_020498 [Zingiber officinale]